MIHVLVISPYPTIRAGLRALLHLTQDIEVVWEASGTSELSQQWPARPDVAVIDAASGTETLSVLAEHAPELGIVILGNAESLRLSSGDAAARGYLTHDASADELAAAVGAVAQGLTVIEPVLIANLIGSQQRDTSPPFTDGEPLTPRELEVLHLLADGLPNKIIANQLKISEHTAKFHVSSVLSKLGAASRTEAVTLAARRGLLLL
jgi:DNA-binding NarL/FixJ family response regulator